MVLVWRIADDSPNSPNFPPPTFPTIQYAPENLCFYKTRLITTQLKYAKMLFSYMQRAKWQKFPTLWWNPTNCKTFLLFNFCSSWCIAQYLAIPWWEKDKSGVCFIWLFQSIFVGYNTMYMEIFMVLNFHVIEIVMLFHNVQGVKFSMIQFCIVYLRHTMIVCIKVCD